MMWGPLSPSVAAAEPERGLAPIRLRVEVTRGYVGAKKELQAAVRRTLGSDWKLAPLFSLAAEEADRARLGRYFVVDGRLGAGDQEQASRVAWDLSYELGDAAASAERVEPDLPHRTYGICAPPADLPGSAAPDWALENMRCRQAWEVPRPPGGLTRGAGIVIGHPDTGYADHPELERAALDLDRDVDLIERDYDAYDPLQRGGLLSPGHGTLTGSVIVSRDGGSMVGVAPLATLLPIRAIRSVVNVFDANVAAAVDYARRVRCDVVSMSLGGLFFLGLEEAINAAVRDGLIVMAAAGNCVGPVVWPALYPNCIAVAATNVEDAPWVDSSRGPKVFISAPGESVWAAGYDLDLRPPRPGVARQSGTSFAVAHLAGVAALWLAHHGRDTLVALFGKSRLQSVFLELLREHGHRRPAGWQTGEFGVGVVDAEALLRAELPDPAEVTAVAEVEGALEAPARPDATQLIGALCPELSARQINARLSKLLQARGAELETKRDRYGGELLYILSEDREAREAFVRGEVTESAAARGPARGSLQTILRGRASRSLLSEMTQP